MEAESHRAQGGEGIPGVRSEEPIVLPLCRTKECAGCIGTKGRSRLCPPTEALVCR